MTDATAAGAIDRLKAQGVNATSINTNGVGGIDNQFEDRSAGSSRRNSGPSGAAGRAVMSDGNEREGRDKGSDNASSSSKSNKAPQRLSDFASGDAAVRRSSAPAAVTSSKGLRSDNAVKPLTSLSSFYKDN